MAAIYILCTVCQAGGQELKIGIIDFYGLSRVSREQVRRALTFKEGDPVSPAEGWSSLKATEDRLAILPGVARARTEVVCCEKGRAIVYVGIEEQGATATRFRPTAQGPARLAGDVVEAGEKFSKALLSAVQAGNAGEDSSQGHALAHDPAMRAIQERFVIYANRDLVQLRTVLQGSSDASQRALAAQVLGYAADKQAVVEDLVPAMSDQSDEVRNNAMRALLVFADAAPSTGRSLQIPARPFIEFLHSPVWTDRNKAVGALMVLSRKRDPELLKTLLQEALAPLVEMARWKSEGHALAPFVILGRIAGYSDAAARDLWNRGNREVVIQAAMKRRKPAV